MSQRVFFISSPDFLDTLLKACILSEMFEIKSIYDVEILLAYGQMHITVESCCNCCQQMLLYIYSTNCAPTVITVNIYSSKSLIFQLNSVPNITQIAVIDQQIIIFLVAGFMKMMPPQHK